jgi:hypothetical protein
MAAKMIASRLVVVRKALPSDAALRGFVPLLWVMALLVTAEAGGSVLDADLAAEALRVADDLGEAASAIPVDTPEHGELLAMRAALLAAEARASGSGPALTSAAGALTEAAGRLPAGHMLRYPVLHALG